MRIQKWVVLITLFLIINTYYDGKITNILSKGKKYYTMALYGFIGISIYMFIKKHPNESKNMLVHANDLIRYMPVDKGTTDLLSPIMDFTTLREKFTGLQPLSSNNNTVHHSGVIPHLSAVSNQFTSPQHKRMLNSGNFTSSSKKRCVSEAKKKYIAAQQKWKCSMCSILLDETYEVDHKIDLQYGGSNHVSNLTALCPNCHRKKTMKKHLA